MDNRIEKGDEVWPELVDAINNSYLCIVVFSKGYASSTWCLRELTHIIESKKQKQVIPVFYQIDPSDIRKQKGHFKKAFREYEKDSEHDEKTVQRWKSSLKKAANFSGFDSKSHVHRDEYQFIENIVRDVCRNLCCIYPKCEIRGLVGIDNNCACIEALLRECQTIGLWGMGGIGKTTIARVIFAKYYSQYEGHCFLANVREKSGKAGQGLYDLRNELFSKLLEEESSHLGMLNMESHFIKTRLRRKKVFIVLDDVDTIKQFEYLVGEANCFGPNSRIIITTRNNSVLRGRVDKVHKVEKLNFQNSLQLFNMKAFERDHPQMGFDELSKMVVIYCKGIPLALEVLGSFLRSREKEIWESTLRKLKEHSHEEIQNALILSYDGLNDEVKEIFLDIAFFFKGYKKDDIKKLLDIEVDIAMEILQDRALISISDLNTVEMHDLIQEMGWQVVRRECKDPKGRSRLRDPKEALIVLKSSKGSDKVQGMILDVSQITDLQLSGDTLKTMTNLRLIKFYCPYQWYARRCNMYYPSGQIRSFAYENSGFMEYLSLISSLEKLPGFHIPDIHVRKLWHEVQDIVSLKRKNFNRFIQLMELPSFSESLIMESIDLSKSQISCPVQLSPREKNSMHDSRIKNHHNRLEIEVNSKEMDLSGFNQMVEQANLSFESDLGLYPSGCPNWCDVFHLFLKLDLSWCVKLKNHQADEIHLTSLKESIEQVCSSLQEFSLISFEREKLTIRPRPRCPKLLRLFSSHFIFILTNLTISFSFSSSLNALVLDSIDVESLSETIKQLSGNMVPIPKWSTYVITRASLGIGLCRPSEKLWTVENICRVIISQIDGLKKLEEPRTYVNIEEIECGGHDQEDQNEHGRLSSKGNYLPTNSNSNSNAKRQRFDGKDFCLDGSYNAWSWRYCAKRALKGVLHIVLGIEKRL